MKNGELESQVDRNGSWSSTISMSQFQKKLGFVNELLTKKKLQKIISNVFKIVGMARTAHFLDDIKSLGFQMAYKGGLSMGLDNINVPAEKEKLVAQAKEEVDAVWQNYLMGSDHG